MKRVSKFRTFVTAAVLAAATLPAQAETLTDALIGAYRNSQLLEQNRALLRVADERVAQAVASLRPVLRFVARAEARDPKLRGDRIILTQALTANWLLYDFGTTQFRTAALKETVLATRHALVSIEQDVLLNAVSAYMNLRRAREVVALSQNNVTLIARELRAANDRFEVGEITRTDVALAQSRLAEARSALVEAQGLLADAREFYRFAVGRLPATLAPPPPAPRTASSLGAATAVALRQHPAILEAQHQVAANDLSVAEAEANRKPKLNLSAGVNRDSTTDELSSNVALELSSTLYQGGAQSSAIRAAVANAEAARANLRQVVRLVRQDVAEAWSAVEVAEASIAASNERIRAAQVAFRGTREEAALGARTTLDVLDAEQELLDARTSLVTAQTERYVAVYELLSAMGLLTVEHLNLGIRTYDPAAYYNAVKNAPLTTGRGDKLDRVLRALGQK
jgi:outer membrane protein